MILSMKLLHEYIDLNIDLHDKSQIKEYCDKMTMSGSKVEGYKIIGEDIQNVVTGQIRSIEKHPAADKLSVCTVDTGTGSDIIIVTGAKNVNAGDIVPVALVGAELPGGKTIAQANLRGVESFGMLCSLSELGLTLNDFPYADENGILILHEDVKIGEDIRSALKLNDAAVEFEITPNRPDCLSVIGLARESAATYRKKLLSPAGNIDLYGRSSADSTDDIRNYLSVEIRNADLCPRYVAKVVRDVKIAPSPLWLRAYLRTSGIRPINNIVDITNYIMLVYGQPMHAFDYRYIEGNTIIVRNAAENEKITTLDSAVHELTSDMIVIADGTKAVALAGVMGGENSEIKDDTVTVVFESACFDKKSVRTTSQILGITTEASIHFSKGIAPETAMEAILKACELCEQLGAGTTVNGIIDEYPKKTVEITVPLECGRINALLGTAITEPEMIEILELLDFKVTDGNIKIPYYRTDIAMCADIAEEIARIYGYNNIGAGNVNGIHSMAQIRGGRNARQKFERKLHDLCTGMGLTEICTYSYVNPKAFDKLGLADNNPLREQIRLINPLGEETSVMRTTLTANMLETLAKNNAHKNKTAYFYELSKVYYPKKGEPDDNYPADEKVKLCIGFYDENADFYNLKGYMDNILKILNMGDYHYNSDISNDNLTELFHSGRSGIVTACGMYPAILGEVSPVVSEKFDFRGRVYILEADVDILYSMYNDTEKYIPPLKYPSIVRDLALVCDIGLEAAEVEKLIRKAGGSLVTDITLFDVYEGITILSGKKSLAYSVKLNNPDRTLTDKEANDTISGILKELNANGIVLRQ